VTRTLLAALLTLGLVLAVLAPQTGAAAVAAPAGSREGMGVAPRVPAVPTDLAPLVNWISAQSVPSLLHSYTAGAHTSGLMALLDTGHHGVELSRVERETIACWIDLCVPFCGDYREAHAWTGEEVAAYEQALSRRVELHRPVNCATATSASSDQP
jgi:hypothetical protein